MPHDGTCRHSHRDSPGGREPGRCTPLPRSPPVRWAALSYVGLPPSGTVLPFLRHEEPYASAPRPALIVLDLEAPIASGLRLLEDIRGDPALQDIPVVILSGFPDARERARQGLPGVQGYMDENMPLWEFFFTIRTLVHQLHG